MSSRGAEGPGEYDPSIQPGPHRLTNLNDRYNLATAEGITTPPEIKSAC